MPDIGWCSMNSCWRNEWVVSETGWDWVGLLQVTVPETGKAKQENLQASITLSSWCVFTDRVEHFYSGFLCWKPRMMAKSWHRIWSQWAPVYVTSTCFPSVSPQKFFLSRLGVFCRGASVLSNICSSSCWCPSRLLRQFLWERPASQVRITYSKYFKQMNLT